MLVCIAGVVSNSHFSFLGVISTFVSYVAKMATGRFEPSLGAVSISEYETPNNDLWSHFQSLLYSLTCLKAKNVFGIVEMRKVYQINQAVILVCLFFQYVNSCSGNPVIIPLNANGLRVLNSRTSCRWADSSVL